MSNILEIKNLNKKYEDFSLSDVSFAVPQGYIMGFIGPNGAGKTTTIKSILSMIRPDSGEITLLGKKVPSNDVKNEIGVVMDLPFYVDEWNVNDVESAVAPFYSNWNKDAFTKHLHDFNLSRTKKVQELSRGMKVKLMLAVALSHNARLLILDEPTSGLDPVARDELIELLSEFVSDANKGVLFSTHITTDLEKIADYITFIINGKIEFTGEKDALLESFILIKGGPSELTAEQKKNVIGYREHNVGFEGMIKTANRNQFPSRVSFEKISLDEIIIYMNKEAKNHE